MKPKRLSQNLLAMLFRQLAETQRAGLGLADTLLILGSDADLPKSETAFLANLHKDIEAGKSLSSALAAYPESLAAETIALIRAGEDNGELARALNILANDFEMRIFHGVSAKGALAWPIALMLVLAFIVMLLMIFVIPTFKSVFSSFGADLPLPTLLVMSIADGVAEYWYMVAILAIGLAIWKFRFGRAWPRFAWLDSWLMRTPFVRAYLIKTFVARLTQMLAAGGQAGALLAPAVGHLRAATGNLKLAALTGSLEAQLAAGKDLVTAVREAPHMPGQLAVALQLGLKADRLAATLEQVVRFSESEAARSAVRLQQACLLLAYVATGLIVGFMVIAIYLPIFKLGSVI